MSVVYSAECKAIQKAERPSGMLPILVVLFAFSYVILTLLVVEQGRTIESQRGLIREMLIDSNQLAALRSKVARDEMLRKSPAVAGPSAPAKQQRIPLDTPKAAGKDGRRAGKPSRQTKDAPGKPASDLEDVRRATHTI